MFVVILDVATTWKTLSHHPHDKAFLLNPLSILALPSAALIRIKNTWECTRSVTTSKLWLKSSFQTSPKVGRMWFFGFDLIRYIQTLLATFSGGWRADQVPKS